MKKTDKAFNDVQEYCEVFKDTYNKEFHTNFNIKQLKSRKEIFEDLKDKLKQAIKNADSLNLDENESPYTNMHKVIKHIIE